LDSLSDSAREAHRPAGTDAVTPEVWEKSLVSATGWRELRDGKTVNDSAIDYKRFLAEEHHRFYGRPWCVGRTYFDFLLSKGLRTSDNILDFGCGSGRLAVWLVPFLDAGRYTGVDHHWEAIYAFAQYEVPLHGLAIKRPRIVLDGSLNVSALSQPFDVILDCFVSFHLPKVDRRKLYSEFSASLGPDGRILLPHQPTLDGKVLAELGLRITSDHEVVSDFLAGHLPEKKSKDHWHIIARL